MTISELQKLNQDLSYDDNLTAHFMSHIRLVENEGWIHGEVEYMNRRLITPQVKKNSQPPEFDWLSFFTQQLIPLAKQMVKDYLYELDTRDDRDRARIVDE